MEVIIQKDAEMVAKLAANKIMKLVNQRPNCNLGLATGTTPLKLYAELIRCHKELGLDFSKVSSFNLDEYVGLDSNHPGSYHCYMQEHFFKHVNMDKKKTHIPNGMAKNIPIECEAYEAKIKACGGIDLQILGIGHDGHIGFNEPSSSLGSRTRIKTLTELTRKNNACFFKREKEVPYHVITMGIGTILDSKSCLLLAFGESKAQAIADMIEGPVSSMVPASALQFHPHTTVIIDEAAASMLKRKNYYRWVFDNLPHWQA